MNNRIPEANSKALADVFEPISKTRLALRQFGLSPGAISDLLSEYNLLRSQLLNHTDPENTPAMQEVSSLFNDKDFIAFCLCIKGDLVRDRFCVNEHWVPAYSTVKTLVGLGIPSHLITGLYVSLFHMDSRGLFLGVRAIDYYFIKSCNKYWMFDPVNPHSRLPKPIPHDWFPERSFFELCSKHGVSEQKAKTLALEYKVYWMDAGGVKASWNDHFNNWVSRKTKCPLNA